MKRRNKWLSKQFLVSVGLKAAGFYLISKGYPDLGMGLLAGEGGIYNIAQGIGDGRDLTVNPEESNPLNSRKLLNTAAMGLGSALLASQGDVEGATVLMGVAGGTYSAGEVAAESGPAHRDV